MTLPEYYTLEDSTLWELLLKGDFYVLEVLYKRYYDLLFNYGMKVCTDKEIVKDCIQNLFIKLHQSDCLKETPYVRSYLLKSLKNILFDKLKYIQTTICIHDIPFYSLSDESNFDHLFPLDDEEQLLHKQLSKAFSELTESQKKIIYLRYIKELPYKEIAKITNMNPQSTMNSVSRTLAKLKKLLTKYNKIEKSPTNK